MNYQQTLNLDGTVNPNSVVVISDSGDRRVVNLSVNDPLWIAYLNWLAAGNAPLTAYSGPLSETVKVLAEKIDARVATVYSSWTRFQQEYLLREAAAQAFKDAGYTGDPGVWVSAYAAAVTVTNQQAADTILSQASKLNDALAQLGALRMRKYEVMTAPDAATAQSTYDDIIASINAVAATLT